MIKWLVLLAAIVAVFLIWRRKAMAAEAPRPARERPAREPNVTNISVTVGGDEPASPRPHSPPPPPMREPPPPAAPKAPPPKPSGGGSAGWPVVGTIRSGPEPTRNAGPRGVVQPSSRKSGSSLTTVSL